MDIFQGMRIFVRVVDLGSLTAAAHTLALSTAQVSRLLAELESHLQTRLLHRTTRRLALTEAGERYLERCRRILQDVGEAEAEASGAHLKPHGHLRLHSMTGLGTQLLAPLVSRFCARYPHVEIVMTLSQNHPALLEDGHDIAITLDTELADSDFVAQRLGGVYSVVCAAPSYLALRPAPKVPADLAEHDCLRLLDPNFSERWVFAGPEGELQVAPRYVFQVNVAEALASVARQGMGICLLPSYIAVNYLRDGSLVRLLPNFRLRERTIHALYPSRRFLDAKIKTWIDFLKEELPERLQVENLVLEDQRYWAKD
ncbi:MULTISPECIES: LysR family transcriptional regulator [Pseudomonas]|uniref:LysR family transcriptional regulator n=1 Tax=Pseudomonas TaxID=286 RepID=UPI0007966D3C|nr:MULTISPECIES: LysR family transcriptional regulator [Pseudomonas]KXJ31194.1 LysR family transcriptional regulator [Pseudomonas sp. HUK17]